MLTKITSYNKTKVLSTLQGGGNGGPRGGGFLGASTPATHACPPQSRLPPRNSYTCSSPQGPAHELLLSQGLRLQLRGRPQTLTPSYLRILIWRAESTKRSFAARLRSAQPQRPLSSTRVCSCAAQPTHQESLSKHTLCLHLLQSDLAIKASMLKAEMRSVCTNRPMILKNTICYTLRSHLWCPLAAGQASMVLLCLPTVPSRQILKKQC